jgi:hypothetical protein
MGIYVDGYTLGILYKPCIDYEVYLALHQRAEKEIYENNWFYGE